LRTCPDRPWGPPSLIYNGYRVFPGGKERPGRESDPSPPSSTVVKKEYSYTSTPPMGRTACTEPQCLYKGCTLPYFLIYKRGRGPHIKTRPSEVGHPRSRESVDVFKICLKKKSVRGQEYLAVKFFYNLVCLI